MSKSETLPLVSLAQHFARELTHLQLSESDSPAEAVGKVRRVLDRTAADYARATDDPGLQRAGQWLVEIVKSGTGLIDRASHAEVVWDEVAEKPPFSIKLRPALFYGAAGLLATAGILQGIGLAAWGAGALAGLHALSSVELSRLPFMPKPKALPDETGRMRKASAVVKLDPHGLIAQVTDALKTADHILIRLATPQPETHWRDDARLTSLLQALIEAGRTEDGAFALELTQRELPTLIEGAGLSLIDYSNDKAEWFDRLPASGDGPKTETASPALVTEEGRVVRRGTVWVRQ